MPFSNNPSNYKNEIATYGSKNMVIIYKEFIITHMGAGQDGYKKLFLIS